MKRIVFQTDSVLPHLTQIATITPVKSGIQILESVKFQTIDGGTKLLMMASDNDTWVSVRCDIDEGDEGVSFCLNAKNVVSTLRNLAGLVVTMEIDDETHCVNGTYRNGKFTLPFQGVDLYPLCDVDVSLADVRTIGAKNVYAAIDSVRFASAQDDLRPVMNSVHFDFKPSLGESPHTMVVVASDGMKLIKYEDNNVREHWLGDGSMCGFTLPKKPSTLVASLLCGETGTVDILFTDKNAAFRTEKFEIITRLLEQRYPDYNRVIPDKNAFTCCAKINRDAILGALKRVMPMGDSTMELVKLSFSTEKLTISSENYAFSTSATENIECVVDGVPITIGFKGSVLAQVVQNIRCDTVSMYLRDNSSAARLEPETQLEGFEYVSILMPMLYN